MCESFCDIAHPTCGRAAVPTGVGEPKSAAKLSDSLGTLPCCVGPVQKLWQPLRSRLVTRSVPFAQP